MIRCRRFALALAVVFGLAGLTGCEQIREWLSPSPTYEVVFDKDPGLRLDVVRAKGVTIGKTLSTTLGGEPVGSLVVVAIRIDKKYKDMMRQNVVFVADQGALEYESPPPQGPPLEPGSRLLGFVGAGAFFAFQAKSIATDWVGALMKELSRQLEQIQKPSRPDQGQGGAL